MKKIFSLLLTVLLLTGIFTPTLISVKADENKTYTVTVVNKNPDAGNLTIAYKQGDEYIDDNVQTLTVEAGTKVKFWFKDGLNDGYNIKYWAVYSNGTLSLIEDSSEESGYYTQPKFIKTIEADLTLYCVALSSDDHLVTAYNSSVTDRAGIIDMFVVKDGQSVNMHNEAKPTKQGFNFSHWSKELVNVKEDMSVYPLFTSSVWTVFRDYYPQFFHGLLVTLLLSVISVFLAMLLGIILCLLRMSGIKSLEFIITAYVEVIRGVPLLLQLLLIYVLIGPTKISFGSFFSTEVISCIIALMINSSAYSSEIFRSGIQAVDKGQMEAGRALGLSKWQTMKNIIIPQGLRNALPSIVNELIAIIKETSLAVSIDASIGELMATRKNITAATYINLPPYIVVAIIYFCVTFSLSKVVGLIEKRLAQRD